MDNEECLDLIEKKMGLFALLDEQCRFPKGSDANFVEKIRVEHAGHPNYITKRRKKYPTEFTIFHFAGEVTYDAKGFIEKNKDLV